MAKKKTETAAVGLQDVYTTAQVCEYLHISSNTLYSWIRTGKLKAAKIGRSWYIKRSEVESITTQGTVIT